MKPILLAGFLFVLTNSFIVPDEKVYVCDSEKSVAYHCKEDCSGLKRCKQTVIYITKKEAVKKGKRACKICY
jgi:hypothetical protein